MRKQRQARFGREGSQGQFKPGLDLLVRRRKCDPLASKQTVEEEINIDVSSDIEEEIDILKYLAFICRFTGIRPNGKIVKDWIADKWNTKVILKFMPNQFFIVIFLNEEMKLNVVSVDYWFVDGHPLFMMPWHRNFDPAKYQPYDKPIWICLYSFPPEYWVEQCLKKSG
ncbi:hypothetical protein SUGI_0803530 [Cryptomeria japonica]|nr:hypothetical protein SUGI_0803530 [Cryptomeria japonica]